MASKYISTVLEDYHCKAEKVKQMIKAAHQERWDANISNIENDVHGCQLNAYKILEHLNKHQKDSANIHIINEVK
jgi:hypothetical protein